MAGEKKFKCEMCPYAASRKDTLQRHVKGVHEKVKPHMCEKCHYAAARKIDLQSHVKRVHEKDKPYKCEMCPYAASQKGVFLKNVHMQQLTSSNWRAMYKVHTDISRD